jgi:hydrocephalus-inducing protein
LCNPARSIDIGTALLPAGIDASNIGSIFEEHVVLSNLDPFKPINCSFGLGDKVFNFGTVIAQLDASHAAPAPLDGTSASGSKGDKKPAKAASKGAARASSSGPSSTAISAGSAAAVSLLDEPGAVKVNLKFINPIKVPCTVNFNIKPRGGSQPGESSLLAFCREDEVSLKRRYECVLPVLLRTTCFATGADIAVLHLLSGVRFPMEVLPSSIVIPPHEYRHVTLAFCPKGIQQYSATFEASVVGGGADAATAGFVCELRGEGTLPSLSFQVRWRACSWPAVQVPGSHTWLLGFCVIALPSFVRQHG